MLYLVATPIGNLEDITQRALKTLFWVEVILCEDTRKTLNLLHRYQKPSQTVPKILSYFEENELKRIPEVILELKRGTDIALVTNSGTPTISDPGFKLVRECWQEKIKVISIPGPSSPIASLACSGLPTDKFLFLGFMPSKQSHRIKILNNVKETNKILPFTVIFFESPFRLTRSLSDLKLVFGDIEIVITRELTKIHEETMKDKISVFLERYSLKPPKGEIVVLFNATM